MEKKKPTNKQILYAYGQSYRLMQEAKRHYDIFIKIKAKPSKFLGKH